VFVDQGFGASDEWLALRTERSPSTGEIDLGYSPDQVTWVEYDRREVDPAGNNAYIVVLETPQSTVVVGGTNAKGVTEVATDLSWRLAEGTLQ
jgi:hypothetical protein